MIKIVDRLIYPIFKPDFESSSNTGPVVNSEHTRKTIEENVRSRYISLRENTKLCGFPTHHGMGLGRIGMRGFKQPLLLFLVIL